PTAADNVLIPATASVFPVSSATNACHHLTIETGAKLTMTGGVLSVYGSVNATVNTCFDLQGGNLKLYYGSTFPVDMSFNNLSIYMSPTSSDEIDNTYTLPGMVNIYGNLTVTGTGNLPKINQDLGEGIYLDKNLTINGGLIGMATAPTAEIPSNVPFLALTGSSAQNIKINNNALHALDHTLIITHPDVVLQSTLISVYHLSIQSNFNTQGKNISIRGDLSIFAGTTLTMTNGVVSVYGTITAPDANCFYLPGGTLKLYHGSTFPVDMNFNNLSIYMSPSSAAAVDNTCTLPGLSIINGNLTMNGTGNLPKINQGLDEGIYLAGNLTVNGGLIGMATVPANGLQDHLPYLGLASTSTQNIKINNNPLTNALDHNLIIGNPNVVLQSALSVYNLILQNDLDLKGKNLYISGKVAYIGFSVVTNSLPYAGEIIIENKIPLDDQPLYLRFDKPKVVIADPSTLNDEISLDQNLEVLQLDIAHGTLDLYGHDLTVGRTTSSLGYLKSGYIYNSVSAGTFSLLGNSACPRYQLTGGSFFNFTLNSPNGVEIDNLIQDVAIMHGTTTLTKGSFDIKDHNVYIGVDVGNVSETAGNIFYSTQPATSGGVFVKSTFNSTLNNLNINGSGFIVTSTNPLHEIEISRYCRKETGSPIQTFIYRLFQVKNDAGGTGLGAKIKLKYDESELSGVNESDLWILRKKSTETTWTILNSTVNASSNTVTTVGTYLRIDTSNPNDPDDYTMYTLGDVNNTLREGVFSDEEEFVVEDGLFIYPNPASNHLTVMMNCASAKSELKILNMAGKQMQSKTILTGENGKCREELDISKLPSGIYVVRVVNETGVEVKKFVKE
ncbi:MAG: T9SS type A sorting domain-containing protein, partial [Bacteroidota bacterium]